MATAFEASAGTHPRDAADVGRRDSHETGVRSNFVWTLIGNVVYAAAQWAIVVVLAKWGTPELVGQYALGMAIAVPILMLVNLQLRTVLISDVRSECAFAHYAGNRLVTSGLTLAAIGVIGFCMRLPVQGALTIATIGLAQCIEAVSDIYWGRLQLWQRMDRIALSMIARALFSLAAASGALWLTKNLLCSMAALSAARLAVLLGYDMRPRTHELDTAGPDSERLWPPRWNIAVQRRLIALGWPLGVVALLLALNTAVPRYFIEAYLGPRSVGIFAALAFIPNSGNLLVSALGQATFVPLARYHDKGNSAAFLWLLSKLLAIGLLLGLAGMLFAAVAGRTLLTLLYRPEYAEHSKLLVWFMTAATFSYLGQLIGSAITAARYFYSQIPLFLTVAGSTASFCFLFIPRMGLDGAVMATLTAMAIQLAGCAGLLAWSLRNRGRDFALPAEGTVEA